MREADGPGEVGQERLGAAVVVEEVAARGPRTSRPAARVCAGAGVGHARALADQVDDPRRRHVPARPAGPARPAAEVDLLEVHEIALVEQADGLEDLAADDQAGPGDPVGRAGARRAPAGRRPSGAGAARPARAAGRLSSSPRTEGNRKADAAACRRGPPAGCRRSRRRAVASMNSTRARTAPGRTTVSGFSSRT